MVDFLFIRLPLLLRQVDLCQPEIIGALHQAFEHVRLPGLGVVAGRLELIAFHNMHFPVGNSQDGNQNLTRLPNHAPPQVCDPFRPELCE